MRRPRMTTRRWMIAVAVVGLALTLEVAARRLIDLRSAYEVRAGQYWFANLAYDDPPDYDDPQTPEEIRRMEHREAMRWYNYELYEKYTQASKRPWLPVEPDTPEPK